MTTFDNIPLILTPFADNDEDKVFSFFQSGITRQMTVPTENGGARLTRHQLNGLGYLATLGAFLDRVGYPYGRERLDPTTFGGYPKGAILTTQDNNLVREYVSLVDNNMHPLPTESSDGTYVGNEYWAPTIPTESASFFPDFSGSKYGSEVTIGPVAYNKTSYHDFTAGDSGWYKIARAFSSSYYEHNESFGLNKLSQYKCTIELIGTGITNGRYLIVEQLDGLLGETASCLVPLSKGNTIRITVSNSYYDSVNNQELYCIVYIGKLEEAALQ